MKTTNRSFAGIAALFLAATVLAQSPDQKGQEPAKSDGNSRATADVKTPGNARAATGIETVKPLIQATEEEWKVIGPKLQAVVTARQVAQTYAAGSTNISRGGFPNFGGDSLNGPVGDSMDFRNMRSRGGFGGRAGSTNVGNGGTVATGAATLSTASSPGSNSPAIPPKENSANTSGFNPTNFPGLPAGFDPANLPALPPGFDPANLPALPSGFDPANFPGFPGGGRGGPGGRFPGFGGVNNPVQSALTELKNALADSAIPPEQVKAKVTAVREARQKAIADLAAAQKSLLLMLTPDQEAVLMSLGYID